MGRSDNLTGYSIEVSAAAWKQLSRLPLETYQRIRGELEAVSARVAGRVNQATSLSLVSGDYLALYKLVPERRRLTLLDVVPRPANP